MSAKQKQNTKLTIGRLAEAAGVSIPTVRYYQRRGLMPLPKKPGSGAFREYSDDDLARLLLIKRAQELGFTLAEVLELLDCVGEHDCDAIRTLARAKLAEINERVASLENVRQTLSKLVAKCPHKSPGVCPFILQLRSGRDAKP